MLRMFRALGLFAAAALGVAASSAYAAGDLLVAKGDGRVEVTVTHYYARSDGARAWTGIMAGRDKVASRVRVFDRGGKLVEEFEVENSNKTAFGSTAGLHEKHADAIVERLRRVQ